MSFIKSIGKKIWKRKWLVLILLVVGGGIFFYMRSKSSAEVKQETYTVKRDSIKETLTLTGDIQADEHVSLKFQTAGRVSWVGVKEGDRVTKYQAIASLDQRDVENRLKKYLNTFQSTRSSFDQSKDDNQDQSVNGSTDEGREAAKRLITQSQASLDNAVLDVELQTISKEYGNLFSPIEGIVVRANPATPGVNTGVTDVAYEIVNPDTLYFAATVDQTDVVRIHEGQQGTIIFDAYPDDEVTGIVNTISYTPVAGETGTVYEVKITFNPGAIGTAGYRLGMTGDMEFITKERANVLTVPSQYVTKEKDQYIVLKREGTGNKKVIVKIGEETDGVTEIVDGLQEGDVVVTTVE